MLLIILEFTKIIVTTGYGNSGYISTTELIDVNGTCTSSLSDYPIKIKAATGVYVDGKIVICGGNSPYSNKCYQLMNDKDAFELIYAMEETRAWAKAIVSQGSMLVTGGRDNDTYNKIITSEFVNHQILNNIAPRLNIQMPEPVHRHAILNINHSTIFLIGGVTASSSYTNKTHFYNHDTKQWKIGPELKIGRSTHTAGILIDHVTLYQHVAVVGGFNLVNGGKLNSVELLLHGKNVWSQGTFESF